MTSKYIINLKFMLVLVGFLLASWCVGFISGDKYLASENWYIVLRGFIYAVIFWMVFSLSSWRLSLVWICFPVFLFLALWLKIYWAIIFSVIAFVALRDAWRFDFVAERQPSFEFFMPGALLVLVWVSLSGVGGYGGQVPDYAMHNARLSDLVNYSWPVVYEKISPEGGPIIEGPVMLVFYCAYYLPAALVGKLLDFNAAQQALYYWTLTGCWLALRWLVLLAKDAPPLLAAFVLVFFSGWVFFGVSLACSQVVTDPAYSFWQCGKMLLSSIKEILYNGIFRGGFVDSPVFLDNWSFPVFDPGYWFGGYFSLTTSLYWAPHHAVISWITIALLIYFFEQEQYRYVGFIMGVLTFWSPFISFALFPVALLMLVFSMKRSICLWVSLPNFTGLILAALMFLYYYGQSDSGNSFEIISIKSTMDLYWLFVFHAISWLVIALFIFLSLQKSSARTRLFFIALCISIPSFSLIHYGEFNDLSVRSAVPFYFALAVFLLRAFAIEWSVGSRVRACCLIVLLVPGCFSALFYMASGYAKRDAKMPVQSVATHQYGGLFVGAMDSFYARLFSGHGQIPQHHESK